MKATDLETATKLKARFDNIAKRKTSIKSYKNVTVNVDGHTFPVVAEDAERVLAILTNQLAVQHAECAARAIDIGLEFE